MRPAPGHTQGKRNTPIVVLEFRFAENNVCKPDLCEKRALALGASEQIGCDRIASISTRSRMSSRQSQDCRKFRNWGCDVPSGNVRHVRQLKCADNSALRGSPLSLFSRHKVRERMRGFKCDEDTGDLSCHSTAWALSDTVVRLS